MALQNEVSYTKRIFVLFTIIAILAAIYLANSILFPLFFAFIVSLLVRPIDAFLQEKWRFPKILSVGVTVLITISFFLGIFFLLGSQLKSFMSEIPQMKEHLSKSVNDVYAWIEDKFGVSNGQQKKYMKENLSTTKFVSGESLGAFTGAVAFIILVPVYIFLFLFYRIRLVEFLKKLVKRGGAAQLKEILTSIKVIMRSYLIGLLIEITIVATLTSLGFWIFGIKHPLFLGLLVALLNLIPYIGILIANILCCLITLSGTSDYTSLFTVVGVVAGVQLIDNNFLLPRIVGSKVRINAMASIVSVLVGGLLAGVPGMFLAIPISAMLKIIFDAIPNMQPYGFLLGDETTVKSSWTKKSVAKTEK